jgi:hypothetical protein
MAVVKITREDLKKEEKFLPKNYGLPSHVEWIRCTLLTPYIIPQKCDGFITLMEIDCNEETEMYKLKT